MLSRKYYRLFAQVIKDNSVEIQDETIDDGEVKVYINRVGLICDLMDAFNKDNYNFNGNRFVDACALDDNDDVLEESYR